MPDSDRKNTSNPALAFFAELRRRRVLQIGGAYIAGAWLGAEILNFLFEQFQAPGWAYRLLAIVFVVGFPVSMVLAWTIQVGEDGHWEIDSSRGDYRTLSAAIVTGLLLTAGLSWLILPRRELPPPYQPLPASLAVLPFAHSGSSPQAGTAAETLYRTLMQGLEQSPELTLVRLSPGDAPDDLVVFGRSLGVAWLASGQFAPAAGGSRIELRLLDVVGGRETWNQSFAWDPSKIIETGNDAANGLLEAMALPTLSPQKFTGTDNHEAYLALLAGNKSAAEWSPRSLAVAMEDFQRAIDLDPGYPEAYVGLAQCIYDLLELGVPSADERPVLLERARKAVNIAQKIEPESADAISLLGLGLDNRQLRIQAYERALELDPDHYVSYYRYAVQMKADGDLDEAERLIRRAISLQPRSARFRAELAEILSLQGKAEEAESELKKAAAFQH